MKKQRIKATVIFDIVYTGKMSKRDMKLYAKDASYNWQVRGWDHKIGTDIISQEIEFIEAE